MSKFTIHSYQNVKPLFEIKIFIMTRPIRVTPILKGKDAINFHKIIEANKHKKVDKQTYIAFKKNAQLLEELLKKTNA